LHSGLLSSAQKRDLAARFGSRRDGQAVCRMLHIWDRPAFGLATREAWLQQRFRDGQSDFHELMILAHVV
jgi:hypothetical protein